MIDLSYKPKKEKKSEEPNNAIQGLVFVLFSAFFAYVILSGIAGEYLFF